MGLREQSIVDCFSDLCFSFFRRVGAGGVAKEIYERFWFFRLGPALLVLIIIIIIRDFIFFRKSLHFSLCIFASRDYGRS